MASSWRDIYSLEDLLAYTGWSSCPPQLHHGFNQENLENGAKIWFAMMALHHSSLAPYLVSLRHDIDLQVELYLKQPLSHLQDVTFLSPHLIESVKSLVDSPVIQTRDDRYRAFSLPEKSVGPKSTSKRLLDHINFQFSKWSRETPRYLSPYISVVGPSGVGKSFAVKQLAHTHGQYVIYISFAKEQSTAFPIRSVVANAYNPKNDRSSMERAWVFGLTAQLLFARCARRLGISSQVFWDLQTDPDMLGFQNSLSELVRSWMHAPNANDDSEFPEAQCHVILERHAGHLLGTNRPRNPTLSTGHYLRSDDHPSQTTPSHVLAPNDSSPRIEFVIAIDEARELLDHGLTNNGPERNVRFRAFRTALAKLSAKFDVFGLVLDTTSRVANFSPPLSFDPSQKGFGNNETKELLSPFFQFYTYSLFAPDSIDLKCPDIAAPTVISHGHPMFGAFLKTISLKETLLIASEKIDPDRRLESQTGMIFSEVRYLALLLHIISFEVVHHRFSDKLVSGWMHMLCGLSENREKVKIGQPISPALAHCARRHLEKGSVLKDALKDLEENLGWGYVSSGDIGEVVAGLGLVLSTRQSIAIEQLPSTPLPEFVESFLSKEVMKVLLQRSGKRHIWLKSGVIFFNRLVRFQSYERKYPTVDDLLYLYASCSACFLPHQAPGADILIPVWVPARGRRAACMGCILVQVKNRKDDSLCADLRNDAHKSISTAIDKLGFDAKRTPILGIMACLRGRVGSEVVDAGVSGVPICLGVGWSPEVFSFLQGQSEEVRDAFKALLDSRTNSKILDSHYAKYAYETTGAFMRPSEIV